MKVIFVTIEEFLENGGILEKGREIYRADARHIDSKLFDKSGLLKNSLLIGEYLSEDRERGAYLVTNASLISFCVSGTIGYIKIEAKPIYK